jgi:hypothetical protein
VIASNERKWAIRMGGSLGGAVSASLLFTLPVHWSMSWRLKRGLLPRYCARYTALSQYHSNPIKSAKLDLSVEATQQSAAISLLRGHDGGSSISSAAASTLTGVPPSVARVRGSNIPFVRSPYAHYSTGGQRTMSSMNMDIRHQSNNAHVERQLPTFPCSKYPWCSGWKVESPEFKR